MFVLRIECSRVAAIAVEVALDALGAAATRWDDAESDRICFSEYFLDQAAAKARAFEVERVLAQWADDGHCAVGVTELEDRDWQEAWKATIHADRVSERVVVKPSWDTWDGNPDDVVVEIDPGMSFGTGLHFTTQSCIRFMDRIQSTSPVNRFCDLGCGSGILSIAAAKLGIPEVVAFDCDPDAVRITEENCARNRVGPTVVARTAALCDIDLGDSDRFPLVAANILAHVLRDEVDTITRTVASGGALMLAGTTEQDFPEVKKLYVSRGFCCLEEDGDGEWRSGLFSKNEGGPA